MFWIEWCGGVLWLIMDNLLVNVLLFVLCDDFDCIFCEVLFDLVVCCVVFIGVGDMFLVGGDICWM